MVLNPMVAIATQIEFAPNLRNKSANDPNGKIREMTAITVYIIYALETVLRELVFWLFI